MHCSLKTLAVMLTLLAVAGCNEENPLEMAPQQAMAGIEQYMMHQFDPKFKEADLRACGEAVVSDLTSPACDKFVPYLTNSLNKQKRFTVPLKPEHWLSKKFWNHYLEVQKAEDIVRQKNLREMKARFDKSRAGWKLKHVK